MKFPTATRRDHQRFCVTERWELRTNSRGKTGTHHENYELVLHDGRILFTRISHPVNRTNYGPGIWSHVLRDQLEVGNTEFWACVRTGALPDRGGPSPVPKGAIPAGVVAALIGTFRLSEAEVRAMTPAEAISRLAELYSEQI